MPATTRLYALGLDKEEILSTFYNTVEYKFAKKGWTVPYVKERWRGAKPVRDLVDAKTGDIVAPAGKKISARAANKLADLDLAQLGFRLHDHHIRMANRHDLLATHAGATGIHRRSIRRGLWRLRAIQGLSQG